MPPITSVAPTTMRSRPSGTSLRVQPSVSCQGSTPATVPGATAKNATLANAAVGVCIAGSGAGGLGLVRVPVSRQVLGEVCGALVGKEQLRALEFDHFGDARDRVAQPVGPAHVEETVAGSPD